MSEQTQLIDAPKSGPTIRRGSSKQDYETPEDFMTAVRNRFGMIRWDLAAHAGNKKCENYFDIARNSLVQKWHLLEGWLWLNPEYDDIPTWAAKCAGEVQLGARILFLTPASVGTNWFDYSVRPFAHSIFLKGRIQFVGSPDPYPKDLMLSVYAYGLTGNSVWKWK